MATQNAKLVQVTKDEHGNELVMVRADKTMKMMMSEKTSSRWDATYWHPKYECSYIDGITNTLGDYITFTTYGQVGARDYSSSGVVHLSPANLPIVDGIITGINFEIRKKYVTEGGRSDPPRSRLKHGDILLSNSGVAATGRPAIYLCSNKKVNISQHINLIRLSENINKYFVVVYLNTSFAQLQMDRFKTSVGPTALTFDEIKSIKIPSLDTKIQSNIESQFMIIHDIHKRAEIKLRSNDREGYNSLIFTRSASCMGYP